ncbi:DUF935 domain-containing protein [Mameliella sp. CS4]|uniref:DUF935 domain-containing protein n=1 Tax=Mameliella sp. CS4 TaxID=2862329 RepID=UPI001C5D16CA|nr:DUF935 domain-containing protein [Mameliella sp. CS4]MBW4984749.1 DUF935 domain-containing protein [Mameliella sp. CS4]
MTQLVDQWGRPVRRRELTREVAGPSLTGVRSPLTGYPGDGLDPRRLANILREADEGHPERQLELAEAMEERDLHYVGVLGTRKRSVTQLDITVEDASSDAIDKRIAEDLRTWLLRDELEEELFDILDSIGKGYSFTEIIWEQSTGQIWPVRLEARDPRWFRFDRRDLKTPILIGENGQDEPMPAYKFIHPRIRAKSGITPRSGICRAVTWAYLFKMYTLRDWAIFTQTYGQPLRVGRYPVGASEDDRNTLFRAVANIAGDCAAIMPEGMEIEFVETKNVGASVDLYESRADWLDKQVSKAVLGQTATTDAEVGGLGSGKEHRMVQEDIERADAKALSGALNRDLVRPWVDLNYREHGRYPRIVIARPEAEDLAKWMETVGEAVDRGLAVAEDDVYAKLGLRRPSEGAKILRPGGQNALQAPGQPGAGDGNPHESAVKYPLNTLAALSAAVGRDDERGRSAGGTAPLDIAVDQLTEEAAPEIEAMLAQIEAMMGTADSLDELREMLLGAYPAISQDALAQVLAQAFIAGDLAGRLMAGDGDG